VTLCICATSEVNLINARNGTGDYAKDNKQRRNYRVIAVVRTSTYILAAASRKSGITNLSQIKDRKQPTFIERGNDTDIVFDYYGSRNKSKPRAEAFFRRSSAVRANIERRPMSSSAPA
jgi:hypothetical protein